MKETEEDMNPFPTMHMSREKSLLLLPTLNTEEDVI